ncbi:MAG: hypothetical protein ABL911_02115 [Gallionella sp.]
MKSFLKSLFGSGNPPSLEVRPRTRFDWKAGLHLAATEDTHLAFPRAVWKEGEPFSNVFSISDDAVDVGFENKDGSGQTISICLKVGQSIQVHRSVEASVVAKDDRVRRFNVLSQ